MSNIVHISKDYETYSEVNLLEAGAYKYARHPSTEVIFMAHKILGSDIRPDLWTPDQPLPDCLKSPYKYHFHAWNSMFEFLIMKYVLKIDPPPFSQWTDTMILAANLSLPLALAKCAPAVGLPADKQKLKEGRALMSLLSSPQEKVFSDTKKESAFEKKIAFKRDNVIEILEEGKTYLKYRVRDPEKLRQYGEYCIQDVVTEEAVGKICGPLSPKERELWELDQKINLRGVRFDVPKVKVAMKMRNERVDQLHNELYDITGGLIDAATKTQQMKSFIQDEYDYSLPDFSAPSLLEAQEDPDIPDVVNRLITIRQQAGKSSLQKFDSIIKTAWRSDHRVRGLLQFLGTTTGRWSGRLVQPHNFPRPLFSDTDSCIDIFDDGLDTIETFYGDPMVALLSCLRGMIIPNPGNELFVCDFSSIEARVFAWLAGMEDVLEVFRTHGKIYEATAAGIYKKSIEDITPDERFIGKVASLSVQYQGSFRALMKMAKQYGKKLDKVFAAGIVRDWRLANPKAKIFWDSLNEKCTWAIDNPGKIAQLGVLRFLKRKDFLYIRLPSGRKLAYPRALLKWGKVSHEDEYGEWKTFNTRQIRFMGLDKNSNWGRQATYGGSIAENVTSGIARDLLAAAMVRVEKKRYPVICTIHDEIISERKIGRGSIEEFNQQMCILPKWAAGIPVGGDGFVSQRWRKS